MERRDARGVSRRELLAGGATAGAALALGESSARALSAKRFSVVRRIDFTEAGPAAGWGPAWRTVGVANLRQTAGEGLLEAGSDVFPNDPRPVAYAVDARIRDGEISAAITSVGSAPGVIMRRTSARSYYAAVFDTRIPALLIYERNGAQLRELARTPSLLVRPPLRLTLAVTGGHPTTLLAELRDADGRAISAQATDGSEHLQGPGDAGVLATSETLFPSDRNPILPALGNLHLLPWSTQEGQAVMSTELGQAVVAEIRRRSTAGFGEIVVRSSENRRRTVPSVVAATTGAPLPGGARLHVATDIPAKVLLELSYSADFTRAWMIPAGQTDRFLGASRPVRGLEPGRRVYWRPRLRRDRRTVVGPTRSFRVLPGLGSGTATRIAIASCGAQFGPIFGHLARLDPDVFIWQGDLNYPDTHGPLAQTIGGYAGIWRDFLANPLLAPLLQRSSFAAQRDDHDYGIQDSNSTNVDRYPWGLAPWESLVNPRHFYRFPAGVAEIWVLDQRRFKTDPAAPDTIDKTLLGERQRRWLLRTLALSPAPFKVICSPTTVLIGANARDGNWGAGFMAERELIFDHIDHRVSGTTIFLTGDTHLTAVFDADGRYEARASPIGIPTPNDITLVDPLAASRLRRSPGVTYAGEECHLALLEARREGGHPILELKLVREDGAVPYAKRFSG